MKNSVVVTHPTPLRLVVLVLGLAGCGAFNNLVHPPKPDGGAGADAGQPVTDSGVPMKDAGLSPTEVCVSLNAARCEYLARCGLIGSEADAREQCEAQAHATWCGPTTWPAHVAVGALRLDPARATDCAQALSSARCADWATLPSSCSTFLSPRVPLGQPCYDGYAECLDGVCRGAACPRTCQPRGVLGEVCSVDGDCRSGLYCKVATGASGVGQCATFATVDTVCAADSHCAEGLRCIDTFCRRLPGLNEPCFQGHCEDGLYCGDLGQGPVCLTRKRAGDACLSDICAAGLVCEPVLGQCAPQEVLAGEPCGLLQHCPAGLTCLGLTPTAPGSCGTPVPIGEACAGAVDCEAHLACSSADEDGGTSCRLRSAPGEACDTARQCQVTGACLDGGCVELPLPGEACAHTRACRWGLCRPGAVDGGYVCGALLGPGVACRRNEECASGQCSQGTCLARCVP